MKRLIDLPVLLIAQKIEGAFDPSPLTSEYWVTSHLLEPKIAEKYLKFEKREQRLECSGDYEQGYTPDFLSASDCGRLWRCLSTKARMALTSKGDTTGSSGKDGLWLGGGVARGRAVLSALVESNLKDAVGKQMQGWNREFELDHIKPISLGGEDCPQNWRFIKRQVNQIKHARGRANLLDSLLMQSLRSEDEYRGLLAAAKAAGYAKQSKIAELSTKESRDQLSFAKVSKMRVRQLKPIMLGLGISYRTVKTCIDSSGGLSSTGVLPVAALRRLTLEGLALERLRAEGKTAYPHNALIMTAREIGCALEERRGFQYNHRLTKELYKIASKGVSSTTADTLKKLVSERILDDQAQ